MDNPMYIATHLPKGEILAQLAEEAAELAQAALKLRRALDDVNPTPVITEEARKHLIEEIADVDLCLLLALDVKDFDPIVPIIDEKAARWRKRLEEHHG